MKMKPSFCLILILGLSQTIYAQESSLQDVKEILFIERAQFGNEALRENSFYRIDNLLHGSLPSLPTNTRQVYTSMITKAIYEIKAAEVNEGVLVWQIFNHGFVIKTPNITIGIDLKDYFYTSIFLELADIIDILFTSHEHLDHSSAELISLLKSMDKPIVGCKEWAIPTIGMITGETIIIEGLTVTAHYGRHSVPVRQFEIVTPDGIRILHTGDNSSSETLPLIENVDILLLNSWINETGATTSIEGVRNAVTRLSPGVTILGHIMELWHLVNGWNPVTYSTALVSGYGLPGFEYQVLAWGEQYQYGIASFDTVLPNPVLHTDYNFVGDSIILAWDKPNPALDGDTAVFYRININDSTDLYSDENSIHLIANVVQEANVKIYSYDNCGNQGLPYTGSITATINEENNTINEFALFQNYPNPVEASTILSFKTPVSSEVKLTIVNSTGQKVIELFDSAVKPGTHEMCWDGSGINGTRLPGGIYYLVMSCQNYFGARKILLQATQ